ncbi:hypothetical protein H6G93_32425 [Nostoc sp. FACHB-973]|nr:hypothetical protein [Nostoc sp. FACHB-973]
MKSFNRNAMQPTNLRVLPAGVKTTANSSTILKGDRPPQMKGFIAHL